MGYEPLYLPSIMYCSSPSPGRPRYTPERAERELYLLNLSSPGSICYGDGMQFENRSFWDNHFPYYPAFKRCNERLKDKGQIRSLGVKAPGGNKKDRLLKVRTEVDHRIAAWLLSRQKVH